jgi:hypothetical protein
MPTDPGADFVVPEWLPRFIEDLVLVQTAAGMVRKVPRAATLDQMNAIGTGAALLRGKEISGEWERLVATSSTEADEAARSNLREPRPVILITHEPHAVSYAGIEYPIGKRIQMRYESVRLGGIAVHVGDRVEMGSIPAEWDDAVPGGAEVVLVPGTSNVGHMSLLSDIGEAETLQDPADE